MRKRRYYFMATFINYFQTKVEMPLPLDIDTWSAAVRWLSTRVPEKHALYSIRVELILSENLCDNQETQKEKEKEISAE